MALAHTIGDKVEAAYRRGDLFEKRKRMMDGWGEVLRHRCQGKECGGDQSVNTLPINYPTAFTTNENPATRGGGYSDIRQK